MISWKILFPLICFGKKNPNTTCWNFNLFCDGRTNLIQRMLSTQVGHVVDTILTIYEKSLSYFTAYFQLKYIQKYIQQSDKSCECERLNGAVIICNSMNIVCGICDRYFMNGCRQQAGVPGCITTKQIKRLNNNADTSRPLNILYSIIIF